MLLVNHSSLLANYTQIGYCNEYSIEFLARTRGHGITKSLKAFEGLEIDLSNLEAVTIQEGGQTALMQGGVWAAPVIEALWEQGYVTSWYHPTASDSVLGLFC